MRLPPTRATRESGTITSQPRFASRPPRRHVDGILLLDKPLGLSSNQALQQVRRLFQAEKAGHTGSLDPLATGMLPICFGEATKLCGLLLDSNKRYVARARLGQKTTTGDAEGNVIETSDTSQLRREAFDSIKPQFLGPISQVPPMYSALKHEARRLYELARAGEEVERAPRDVVIHELQLGALEEDQMDVTVACSKGTYIRTLVEDIAAAAGQCAHLAALRRVSVHPFDDLRVWTMPELEEIAARGLPALDELLLPMSAAVADWPQVRLMPELLVRMYRGQPVKCPETPVSAVENDVAVMDQAGVLRAIGRWDGGGQLCPRRWLGGQISA